MMTVHEAVARLRATPRYAELIRHAYLGADVAEASRRFATSAEFQEAKRLLASRLGGGAVLDVGAGNGIASFAFATAGAEAVYALEPDLSDQIGARAITVVCGALDVYAVAGVGEAIPLPDRCVDVVYARQVLHHARDLSLLVQECARVLRPGGLLLATREHVVDSARQLQAFLSAHPIHALAGGEHAYTRDAYRAAFRAAGLQMVQELGPWDAVMNAFPEVESAGELNDIARIALARRFGTLGKRLGSVPGATWLTWAWLRHRRTPGRLYSFLLRKP